MRWGVLFRVETSRFQETYTPGRYPAAKELGGSCQTTERGKWHDAEGGVVLVHFCPCLQIYFASLARSMQTGRQAGRHGEVSSASTPLLDGQ